DGIRDDLVTGVQTCALPISQTERRATARGNDDRSCSDRRSHCRSAKPGSLASASAQTGRTSRRAGGPEIYARGRARRARNVRLRSEERRVGEAGGTRGGGGE